MHLKLSHTQCPGRGPTIWCIVRSLTLFLHKRLFPGLEPVTFQLHDNNFTSCAKVTPHFYTINNENIIFKFTRKLMILLLPKYMKILPRYMANYMNILLQIQLLTLIPTQLNNTCKLLEKGLY